MNEQIYLTQEEINHPYANIVTMIADKKAKYESLKNTLFAKITESPETLAETLVFTSYFEDCHYRVRAWKSVFFLRNRYRTKSEAIAATVAKLKEVAE